jgi:hypothetical protein
MSRFRALVLSLFAFSTAVLRGGEPAASAGGGLPFTKMPQGPVAGEEQGGRHPWLLCDGAEPGKKEAVPLIKPAVPLIKPAVPTGTGLLLEPPLELAWFTTEDFAKASASVGEERIHKKWTSPVTVLPPHPRPDAKGLTREEVKDYMRQVRRLFEEGKAIPISDTGLISTQEDVIRRPMLNHIAAFSNATVRAYVLVQRTMKDKGWGYFSIVQDLTVDPPVDYYGHVKDATEVQFEGRSCYKCHSSGPLAIHPARADLVSDPPLAAAISKHIANQPRSRFYFPPEEKEPAPDYGKPMALKFCTRCHEEDGDRAPLFKVHAHPIRVLVDFGYMPPNRSLTPAEVAELKKWLEQKP